MNKIQRVAAIQMNSSADRKRNLDTAASLISRAAGTGAQLVLLPENFSGIPAREQDRELYCEQAGTGLAQDFLSQQAKLHSLWLIGGSIWLRDKTKNNACYNSCLVYDPGGKQVARYDKIHLFDVQVTAGGTASEYCESSFFSPGEKLHVIDAAGLQVGISICYDLRFPELYRQLQAMGAELIVVPSAFTAATGKLHWEIMLRARAAENQCYLLAANQAGRHDDGRETWGHSMVLDPWGAVADCVPAGNGIATCDCDWNSMHGYRESFPALQHIKLHRHP